MLVKDLIEMLFSIVATTNNNPEIMSAPVVFKLEDIELLTDCIEWDIKGGKLVIYEKD